MKGKVTADMLANAGACEGEVARFRAEWPNGCRATWRNCRRAAELDLDLRWAVDHLLPESAYVSFMAELAPALEAYKKATAPALEVYLADDPSSHKPRAAAWKAYEKETAPARKVYREAMAEAFYRVAWQTPYGIG